MSKMNLKTQAYNTIRQKIVTCEYAPGTFLNEELLTTELGLSRTPVRDALSRLEQEGLIEIKPKKGIIVMPLSINTINMIFEVRQLYEPYILLNYGNALSVERLKDFYNIFSSSKTNHNCYNNNDYFYELDTEFHNFVVDACPNTYIHQNYNMIQTQAERFRYMTGNISEKRLDDTFQEHLDIIRACLRNDWQERYKPATPEEPHDPRFEEALHTTETIEHLTDCVALGTPQQKADAAAQLLSRSYLLMLEERIDRLALAKCA